MSRDRYTGPKLPGILLDQVQSGGVSKRRQQVSRKDQRKAERQAKKQQPSRREQQVQEKLDRRRNVQAATRWTKGVNDVGIRQPAAQAQPAKDARPIKSILKKRKEPTPEEESEDDDDAASGSDGSGEDAWDDKSEGSMSELTVSRPSKRQLEEDDEEIAALEKKLGIKGKKAKQDDGLDWLAGGSESDGEDGGRPEDLEWLKSKRRKVKPELHETSDNGSDRSLSDDEGQDDFDGFSSGSDEGEMQSGASVPHKRENPYVAPGTGHGISSPAGKYVPPSLRKAATSDEEMLRQLHRQVQGKVNKVTEVNIVSIVKEVEDIYKTNARQHVTSTLIDILVRLMTADVAHADTVLITNAGFAAALYRVIGTDFGAQLVERIVERHEHFSNLSSSIGDGKQRLNLLAFLSHLYNFQVVGHGILFDYIRLLLAELTEPNTEMLLRVIRISGPQLRQDDPSALKDIVMLVSKLVARAGEENLSVRTKFMIETIHNLKNNRMKTGLVASGIAAEQTTRMKKTLGTLNARAKATEPLRLTLQDIQDTEKKGKWWLVGASYHDPAKLATPTSSSNNPSTSITSVDPDAAYESETPGTVNLSRLARQQGMNTDVRRAIFISLLSASSVQDAHRRLDKLRLKSRQQLEVPRVIVGCVGGEEGYNGFYALVARRLCLAGDLAASGADFDEQAGGKRGGGAGGGARAMRKAFQFGLWGFWREMENEDSGGQDGDAGDGQGPVSIRRVVHLAKFYAALVADGCLSLAVLKKCDFGYGVMPAKQAMWAEVFLTGLLFRLMRDAAKGVGIKPEGDDVDKIFKVRVKRVFSPAGVEAETLGGLRRFMEATVRGSELARTKRERRALTEGCPVAVEALRIAADSSVPYSDGAESDET